MPSKTRKFERLLEAVPDALVGMDQAGVVRFVNHQTELLFGYDRDELVGQPIQTLVPEELWEVYSEHREEYFADPRTRSMGLDLQLTGRQLDGIELPVNINLSHLDTGGVLLVITAVREVTRHAQALEDSRLLAAIVENSNDAIIAGTLDGIVRSWNPAAERMYGYSSEEMVGMSRDRLGPQGTGEITSILARIKAGLRVEHFETQRVRRDGTVFPVSLTVSPIRAKDGAVVGWSTIARDLTELRAAATRAQDLIEAAPDALVGVDQDGVIRFVNRQTELLFGYDRDALVGQLVEILVPESFRAVHPGHRGSYGADPVARPVRAELELTGLRRDGTQFPVDISLSSVQTQAGLLVTAAVRDVTEPRRAFEAAQRLASIVESSDDAIIGRTLDGSITSWNAAAERMYGYSGQEIVGKPVELLSPPGRSEEIKDILAKVRAGQVVEHFETERVRRDGTVFPVSLTASPIRDPSGAVVGASTIARDVTKEKEAFEVARSMIESSLDALVAIGPEGMITDANEATVKATGISRPELIGTAFSQCFTEPEKANAIYQLVFEQGMAVDYPLTMHHRDGTLTEVLYNASVYRDVLGKVLGVFAAARDVTKQNQAHREIAEQRANELNRLADLERFQRITVGRELKMIELKKENEDLRKLGRGHSGDLGDLG